MKIVDRSTVINNPGNTRSVQNFGAMLGAKPHKLGQVVSMYPQLSISMLTDALRNVYYNKSKEAGSYTPSNAMVVEWDIDVNYIKTVRVVEDVTTDGLGFSPMKIIFEEKYYFKNETFTADNKQQYFVIKAPRRLGARRWEYTCILVGNDASKRADLRYLKKGKLTRFRSNFYPELSERGWTKYTSNTESHRNYLSRHRASESWTQEYALNEKIYIEETNKDKKAYLQLNRKEKACMDHFLVARENSNLFSITNYDVSGKCMHQDDDGQDIPMGDGVITQIEKACDKFAYSSLSSDVLDTVMSTMRSKSDEPIGNEYVIVCNERFYTQVGKVFKEDYRFNNSNDATFFYSKHKGDRIKVGAHFDSYTFQGNQISFMVNRCLSQEYPDHGYGICLDASVDIKEGRPNIASFSLAGTGIISGTINGMGGQDGRTSGTVSTGATGSSYHLWGTSGVAVFNPYKSFIIEEHLV